MCKLPIDPPTPKEIGNCELCESPLYRDAEHNCHRCYNCSLWGRSTCNECKAKCSQCGTQGCQQCLIYDLDNHQYFCDTAPMAVETTPERLKQSECRADWLIDGDDSIVDGAAGELGIGDC